MAHNTAPLPDFMMRVERANGMTCDVPGYDPPDLIPSHPAAAAAGEVHARHYGLDTAGLLIAWDGARLRDLPSFPARRA